MTKSTTDVKTVEILKTIFASNSLSEQLVSDNGPQFVSEEVKECVRQKGIQHPPSSPYHPANNGLAERFVHIQASSSFYERRGMKCASETSEISLSLQKYSSLHHH